MREGKGNKMALYWYRGLTGQGDLLQGYVAGKNMQEVRHGFAFRQLELLSLRRHRWVRMDSKELSLFFLYLAYALEAGNPLAAALLLVQESFRGFLKDLIGTLLEQLRQGALLSEALESYPELFPPDLVALVNLGERSGQFVHTCHQASQWVNHREQKRTRIFQALSHPLLNFSFFLVAFFFLCKQLLPNVVLFLQEEGHTLPWATKMLLNLLSFSWKPVLVLAGMIILCWMCQPMLEPLLFRVVGPLWVRKPYLVFFSSLRLLLQEKNPILPSLEIAVYSVSSPILARAFAALIQDVQEGKTLSQALDRLPYFPDRYRQWMVVGESTGHPIQALVATTQMMAKEMQHWTDRLLFWITPGLTVLIGLCLWFLLEGTFLPLYETIGKTRNSIEGP